MKIKEVEAEEMKLKKILDETMCEKCKDNIEGLARVDCACEKYKEALTRILELVEKEKGEKNG